MFTEIDSLIRSDNFFIADQELRKYIASGNKQNQAYAHFLIGYIYSHWKNPEKNILRARRHVLNNLNSDYPVYEAYILYAEIEEDKNVAIKYLEQGLTKFPNHPELLKCLLTYANDKSDIIYRIKESGCIDFDLLIRVIEELIKMHDWEKTKRVISRIRLNYELSVDDAIHLDLIEGFSYAFGTRLDYDKAIRLFERSEKNDISNKLGYAHYLGIIYSFIKNNEIEKAITYFDKLPLNNSVFDFDEIFCGLFTIDFYEEYKEIFALLFDVFQHDEIRNRKAKGIYALYLYNPSAMYDKYRYEMCHIDDLKNLFEESYNKHVAIALVDMYIHFEKYDNANLIYLTSLSHGLEFNDCETMIDYFQIVENADEKAMVIISNHIISSMKNGIGFRKKIINENILDCLIERLYELKLYIEIVRVGDYYSVEEICGTSNAFCFAYSYEKDNSPKGLEIYRKMLNDGSEDSSVLNNIGVIFEKKGDFYGALEYFERATKISEKELYLNNINRVKKIIDENRKKDRIRKQNEYVKIRKNISLKYFESIGYDEILISKLQLINDTEIREIILRDMKECAIAIATGQFKTSVIMIGSIMEALIYAKLNERSINSYVLPRKPADKTIKLMDMSLVDLLYVAEKEKLLSTNNIHLSHFIRDYRNYIHPAKEIRSFDEIKSENIIVMWTLLKRIINELMDK